MKYGFFAAVLITLSVFFGACNKPKSLGPQSMTAMINGKPWSATVYLASKNVYGSQNALSISGSSATGDEIYISLANFRGTGVYDLSYGGENFAKYSSYSTDHYARSGTLTIDGSSIVNVQGSFEFVADSSSAVVQQGTFNIVIQ
jgi:hypothetical protein